MRAIVSVVSVLVLVGLFVLAPLAVALSQDRSDGSVSQNMFREWSELAKGRTDFEVSDFEALPNLLKLEIERSICRYKEGLAVAPVRFLQIESRRLAFIVCWQPVKSTQRVFDLSNLRKPIAVSFPILAYPDGVGTSYDAPGLLVWEKETDLFRAVVTSDLSGTPQVRYTYRLDGSYSFTVLRLESQRVSGGEWTTIWDAPKFSSLPN